MSQIKTVSEIRSEIKKFSPHPEKVKLLAVSKKQSVEKIRALAEEQQQFLFGENYVQEALEKMNQLPKTIKWHLIGHLQSKKVSSIIGKFEYIHSVDSLKLAQLIARKSADAKFIQKIFIEVNLAEEGSKTGFEEEVLKTHWAEVTALPSIEISGLMTLPPLSDDEGVTRGYFRKLNALQQELRKKTDTTRHPMDSLSMGTSQDYPLALQEGATMIRVGTLLFGERV